MTAMLRAPAQARAQLSLPRLSPARKRLLPSRGHGGTGPGSRVLGLTAVVGLLAAGLCLLLPSGGAGVWGTALLAAGVAVAELRPVRVGRQSQHQNFNLVEGPVVIAIALAPGSAVVLAVCLGVAAAQLYRRIVVFKLVYNVSLFALATATASLLAVEVHGVGGVIAGIAAFTVLNDVLMRLVLWAATGQRFGYAWQDGDVVRLLHVAAATSVGLIAAATWQNDPHLLPAFLGPIALVQWSQEQVSRRQTQGSVARALAQQATSLYGRSSHESALLVLRSARELLTCHEAEIVLLGADGAVSVRDSGERTSADATRLDPADLLEGWQGRALENVRATTDDRWAGVVIGQDVPVALLGVWRSTDQDVFRDLDRSLLQQLADDVQSWLSVDVVSSDAVGAARLRAAEAGGRYEQVADALGSIVRVRQALVSVGAQSSADQQLAEDLRVAADGLAEFVSDLLATSPEAEATEDVVQSGVWRARS